MSLFDENMVVDAQRYAVNAKACIQKNGRLGFTREGAELLELSANSKILFSVIPNGDLAAVICDEKELRGFRVQKAGNYYYIRMKNFFDSQGLDYVAKRITYDISETSELYQGKNVFKFKRGIYERRSSDDSNEENFEEQ
jgi:hypothetical protein